MEQELGGFGSGGRSARAHLPYQVLVRNGPVVFGARPHTHTVVGRARREGPYPGFALLSTPTWSRMMRPKVAILFP